MHRANVGLTGVLISVALVSACSFDFDSEFPAWHPNLDAAVDTGHGGAGGTVGDAGKDVAPDHSNGGTNAGGSSGSGGSSGKGGSSGSGGSSATGGSSGKGGSSGSGTGGSPGCSPGATQCSGKNVVTCDTAGQWQISEPCPYLCVSSACQGVCDPGSLQCSGKTPQTCDANGQWQAGTPCPSVCDSGVCKGTCTPGTKQCSSLTPQTCDGTGQWVDGTTCAFVCKTGDCIGVCPPGTNQCSGLTRQQCDADGQWQDVGGPCAYVCIAGACTGVCSPSTKQCAGLVPQTCDANGQWIEGTPCTVSCSAGICDAPKTYADFAAHIGTLTGIVATGSASLSSGGSPVTQIVQNLANAGTMWGTSWGSYFTADSSASRTVQHGLPSQAVFNDRVAHSAKVLVITGAQTSLTAFSSVDRNGYVSSPYADFEGLTITELLYWDFTQNAAFKMHPFAQTGPTAYSF